MTNKLNKTQQKILPLISTILEGKILAVDPSTGSKSSLPGFAWFEKGQLIESGVIEVNLNTNKSLRLYEIARTIREDFDKPDILIVEYIPPMVYSKSKMSGVSLMALQKAIGAIIGAQPFENLLEIPEPAWRHHKPPDYVKSDEYDAISLGLCAINTALKLQNKG